jgi:PIN domain nuclease of toxin-antitoxin system
MAGLGAHWMPIELRHFLAVADLPVIHGDPFDRLLIAQSDCEQVPLLSADANVARYPIQVIW